MPESPLVELVRVGVRRPGTVILRDVSLAVGAGEAVGVFGANGSGKTTLMRTVATLSSPTEGAGRVLGAALGDPEVEAIRPDIGLVGHEPALYPLLTLEENMLLIAGLAGKRPEDAGRALAAVGLGGAGHRRVAACSNGMKRRTEFARLMLTRPRLLLLDEAHVGLDPAAGALVESLVATVVEEGGAALVVSHETERVASLVDRTVTIRNGTIEEAG